MPAELFRAFGGRRQAPGHRIGAVPVSMATHAALLVAAITIPLLASDVLPPPPTRLRPPELAIPVVSVPVTPRPYAARPVPTLPPSAGTVPLAAPNGINDETGVVPRNEAIADVPVADTSLIAGSAEVPGLLEPPPPPFKPVAPVRVGTVQPPRRIHHEPPVYPAAAILARVEGTVVLEAVISTTGTVQQLRVVKSVPLLDQAALDAVTRWTYTPTLLSGVPVPVIMTVQVDFTLAK
ncbi:MAG: energy transducer TonB [Bacteroidales bacterium]